jgi:hypothetical protein
MNSHLAHLTAKIIANRLECRAAAEVVVRGSVRG